MMERRLKRGLALLLTLCLALPLSLAFADEEDAAEMAAYWRIVGSAAPEEPLATAMSGEWDALTLEVLKAVIAERLIDFAAENKLPVSMARHAFYSAMADRLAADVAQRTQSDTEQMLSLFLAMRTNARDQAANAERRALRKDMTEADILAWAAETGLPAGFLAWLLLDDEWFEPEWDDGDDWIEGRRDWSIPDWVDASDVREKYGKDAVVTEDDVERVLRQNGYRFDD